MNAMDCTDIKANLSALLDDVIAPASRRIAERHLAECGKCRRMIDNAEALEALIAADAADREPDLDPLAELETAVLRRTVHAGATRRMTTWLGWVAAAASLLLAMTIWMVTGQGAVRLQGDRADLREWTAPVEVARASAPIVLGPPPGSQTTVTGLGPGITLVSRGSLGARLSPQDAETIEAAAFLLGNLVHADPRSFRDIEDIRAAIELEGLQQRLDGALVRLPSDDWDAFRSAKWILDRIANGPLTLGDIPNLQRDTLRAALVERLGDMVAFANASTSL